MREQLSDPPPAPDLRRQGARARDRGEAAPGQARSTPPRSREAPGHARRRARQARRDRDVAQDAAGADRSRARGAEGRAGQAPGVEEHARSSAPRPARSRTSASRSAIARPSSRRSSRRPPQSHDAARGRATRTSRSCATSSPRARPRWPIRSRRSTRSSPRPRPRATPRARRSRSSWVKTYDTLVGQARLRGRAGDQGRVPGLPHGAPAAAQQHPRAHGVDRDVPALRPPGLSQGAARAEAEEAARSPRRQRLRSRPSRRVSVEAFLDARRARTADRGACR